jgi:hypothetical protein
LGEDGYGEGDSVLRPSLLSKDGEVDYSARVREGDSVPEGHQEVGSK